LDAKYEEADLNTIVKENCIHLSPSDQAKVLKPLTEFEDLYTEPVSLMVRECAKPYHKRPFSTKKQKET
jgi:hypothetical protein